MSFSQQLVQSFCESMEHCTTHSRTHGRQPAGTKRGDEEEGGEREGRDIERLRESWCHPFGYVCPGVGAFQGVCVQWSGMWTCSFVSLIPPSQGHAGSSTLPPNDTICLSGHPAHLLYIYNAPSRPARSTSGTTFHVSPSAPASSLLSIQHPVSTAAVSGGPICVLPVTASDQARDLNQQPAGSERLE